MVLSQAKWREVECTGAHAGTEVDKTCGNSPLMTSVFPLRLDWEFSLLPGSAILVLGTDAEMKRETQAH